MKLLYIFATLVVGILIGCSGPAEPTATDAMNKDKDMEKPSAADKNAPTKVDRTDPTSTAKAVLTAYKEKKFSELSELSHGDNRKMIAEMAKEGPSHPRYNSMFSLGWRWDNVSNWKGEIDEVRYERKSTALVKFGKTGPAEVAVVILEWIDDKWCFEDINSPPKDEFEALAKTRE